MGMYTGVRCKVIIKPEYREEFDHLHNELSYEWSESNYEFLREYGDYSRATFIPKGSLSYMPDSWEYIPKKEDGSRDWMNAQDLDGFDRKFDKETGLWTFQCSLKNYEDTIEYFFENVLSKVAQEVIHLEYYYEEWVESDLYELCDGKIVKSEKDGIKYGYEQSDDYYGVGYN